MPFKSEFKVGKPLNLPRYLKRDSGTWSAVKGITDTFPLVMKHWEEAFRAIHEPIRSYSDAHIYCSMESYGPDTLGLNCHTTPRIQGVFVKEHTIERNKIPEKTLASNGLFYPFGYMAKSHHPFIGKLRDELIAMVRTAPDCIIYEGDVEGAPSALGFLKPEQLKNCKECIMTPGVIHYLTPKTVIRYLHLTHGGPMSYLIVRVPYKNLSDV